MERNIGFGDYEEFSSYLANTLKPIEYRDRCLLVDLVDFLEHGYVLSTSDLIMSMDIFGNYQVTDCRSTQSTEFYQREPARGRFYVLRARRLHVKEFNATVPLEYESPLDVISLLVKGQTIFTEEGIHLEVNLLTLSLIYFKYVGFGRKVYVTDHEPLVFEKDNLPKFYTRKTILKTKAEALKDILDKKLKRSDVLTLEEVQKLLDSKLLQLP